MMLAFLAPQPLFARLLLVGEDDGWMQLLVLVLFAVVYGLGGILRARKQKPDLDAEHERPLARGTRPPARDRAVRSPEPPAPSDGPSPPPPPPAAAPAPPPATEATSAQAASAALEVIFQQLGLREISDATARPAPPGRRGRPHKPRRARSRAGWPLATVAEKTPAVTAKAAGSVQARTEPVPDKPGRADEDQAAPSVVPELSSPDDLRSAILYLEILGKPMALREPGEHLIGP